MSAQAASTMFTWVCISVTLIATVRSRRELNTLQRENDELRTSLAAARDDAERAKARARIAERRAVQR